MTERICYAYRSLPSAGVTMKTLDEITELEQCTFGQPRPRHGLKLLYWFAKDCLTFDQNNVMQSRCHPENGDYGFHTFENKYERKSGKLLPNVAFTYYEVGNLSKPRSYNLPCYVRKDYTHSSDSSNMDRIIVSLNNKCFDRVYVTQHRDRSNFDKDATYCISKNLIRIIRHLTLEEFLLKTGYSKQETIPTSLVGPRNLQPPCPAPPTTSICGPLHNTCTNKDIYEIKPTFILTENNTQGHHKAPSPSPFSISALMPSKNQDDRIKFEPSPIFMKNDAGGRHKAPPVTSIYIPETTNPDFHTDNETSSNLIKNNTPGHHKASPSICSPAITPSSTQDVQKEMESPPTTSSTNQGIYAEIESPPISTNNNNTQVHGIFGESELNNAVQENTNRASRNLDLRTPSEDIQTSSNSTPTIVASRKQNTDFDSSPFSQMNRFFWVVYFFTLVSCFYFSFFGGDVMRITVISVSLKFLWRNWNRGEQGEKKEREGEKANTQTGKMTNSAEKERKENDSKKHAVITCIPTVTSSRNQNTAIDSSPLSQTNAFFWGFYSLFLFSFFYFFWGNVMRIFIISLFLYHLYARKTSGKREKKLR